MSHVPRSPLSKALLIYTYALDRICIGSVLCCRPLIDVIISSYLSLPGYQRVATASAKLWVCVSQSNGLKYGSTEEGKLTLTFQLQLREDTDALWTGISRHCNRELVQDSHFWLPSRLHRDFQHFDVADKHVTCITE